MQCYSMAVYLTRAAAIICITARLSQADDGLASPKKITIHLPYNIQHHHHVGTTYKLEEKSSGEQKKDEGFNPLKDWDPSQIYLKQVEPPPELDDPKKYKTYLRVKETKSVPLLDYFGLDKILSFLKGEDDEKQKVYKVNKVELLHQPPKIEHIYHKDLGGGYTAAASLPGLSGYSQGGVGTVAGAATTTTTTHDNNANLLKQYYSQEALNKYSQKYQTTLKDVDPQNLLKQYYGSIHYGKQKSNNVNSIEQGYKPFQSSQLLSVSHEPGNNGFSTFTHHHHTSTEHPYLAASSGLGQYEIHESEQTEESGKITQGQQVELLAQAAQAVAQQQQHGEIQRAAETHNAFIPMSVTPQFYNYYPMAYQPAANGGAEAVAVAAPQPSLLTSSLAYHDVSKIQPNPKQYEKVGYLVTGEKLLLVSSDGKVAKTINTDDLIKRIDNIKTTPAALSS